MKLISPNSILDIFLHAPGVKPWFTSLCILLSGFLNILSMGAILPAISAVGGEGVASESRLNQIMIGIFQWIGFELTVTNFIILVCVLLTLKSLLVLAALTYVGSSVAAVQSKVRSRLLTAVMRALSPS